VVCSGRAAQERPRRANAFARFGAVFKQGESNFLHTLLPSIQAEEPFEPMSGETIVFDGGDALSKWASAGWRLAIGYANRVCQTVPVAGKPIARVRQWCGVGRE